jgi:hypothetical protein
LIIPVLPWNYLIACPVACLSALRQRILHPGDHLRGPLHGRTGLCQRLALFLHRSVLHANDPIEFLDDRVLFLNQGCCACSPESDTGTVQGREAQHHPQKI